MKPAHCACSSQLLANPTHGQPLQQQLTLCFDTIRNHILRAFSFQCQINSKLDPFYGLRLDSPHFYSDYGDYVSPLLSRHIRDTIINGPTPPNTHNYRPQQFLRTSWVAQSDVAAVAYTTNSFTKCSAALRIISSHRIFSLAPIHVARQNLSLPHTAPRQHTV